MSAQHNRRYITVCLALLCAIGAYFSAAPNKTPLSSTVSKQSNQQPINSTSSLANTPEATFDATKSTEPKIGPAQGNEDNTSKTAALHQTNLPFEDIVTGARLIDEKISAPDSEGWQTRTRLLESNFKYPLVEIEEEVKQSEHGHEEIRSRKALVADHIFVRLKTEGDKSALTELNSRFGDKIREKVFGPNIYLISFENVQIGEARIKAAQYMKESAAIEVAEPDYLGSGSLIPNDPSFGSLWGLNNGSDTDIDAPEAWDQGLGSQDILVAVIDTGVKYNHVDLAARMWTNSGEIPANGLDDDGNGYIDDVYGVDFHNEDSDPIDDHGHGTHCAGTIGAIFNNAVGVTGVAPRSKIMALKWLNYNNSGTSSDAVAAVYYATQKGARITSNSWGISGFSINLYFAIDNARANGNLFIAAAMNNGINIDTTQQYPASHSVDIDNIIAVAATNSSDGRPSWSNYGPTNVHLGAPGESIFSTASDGGYTTMSGTSMATPHVSGAAAFIWSLVPSASYTTIKNCIVNTGDPIASLSGVTISGRRLNLKAAADCAIASSGPTPTSTPTSNATNTPTYTPSRTPTATATRTATSTSTATMTAAATSTATRTATPSATRTNTPLPTSTATRTRTATSTGTHTPTAIGTASATPSATIALTMTATPTSIITSSATPTAIATSTSFATSTPTASPTSNNLTCSDPLLFNSKRLANYGTGGKGETLILESGTNLQLLGDTWKTFPKSYQITPDTVISFEFKLGAEGLFNAIGMDKQRAKVDQTTFFSLNGPLPKGIDRYMDDYTLSSDGWRQYKIPVGKHRTLLASHLTFINATNSSDRISSSEFRNIRFCEPAQPLPSIFQCETNLKVKNNKATLIVKRNGVNDPNKPNINALMLMQSAAGKRRMTLLRITRARPGKVEFTLNPRLANENNTLFVTTDAPDCFSTELKMKGKKNNLR